MATINFGLNYQVDGQISEIYTPNINANWDIIDAQLGGSLTNVQLSTVGSNQVLIYDLSGGVAGKWSNYDYVTADIASRATATTHYDSVVNPTSTDTTRDKHISNNDYKIVYDHSQITSGNPHGITATTVGNAIAQWNADKILGVSVDDSNIDTNKTLIYDGANLVYSAVNATQLNGYDLDFSGISDGYVLSYDSTSEDIVFVPQTGVSSFLSLNDVIDSDYTGKVGYVAKVNATATGLELGTISAGNVDGGDSFSVGDLVTLRNDTEANWTTNGAVVLQNANIGLELNATNGFYWGKIGNGSTSYSSLPYGILPFNVTMLADKHKLQYNSTTETYDTVADTLNNIKDVTISVATNDDLIVYDNSTITWKNKKMKQVSDFQDKIFMDIRGARYV